MKKVCTKCKIEKDLDLFHNKANGKYGKCCHCMCCVKKANNEWRKKNKKKISEANRLMRIKNKEKIAECLAKNYQKNKEKRKSASKKRYHRVKNSEEFKKKCKEYYEKNKDKIIQRQLKKRNSSPKLKLSHNISTGIRDSLKRGKEGYHWETIVGYTVNDLRKHLESLWEPWMNWANYGNPNGDHSNCWHIDHIKPVSWFDFKTYKDPEFKQCWSLSNLQPKEGRANISKQNRFIG